MLGPGKLGFENVNMGLNFNLLLTKHKGHTGKYCPEIIAVWTKYSKVRTKMNEGQYSAVWLKQASLVKSLLYGTRVMQLMTVSMEMVCMAKS